MNDGLKNKAYLEASRLKNSGHNDEVIFARLEKQGVPKELINEVLFNLTLQKLIDKDKYSRPFYNLAIFKIAIGILLAIVSALVIPGQIFLPIGLVISGIVYAVAAKKNMI